MFRCAIFRYIPPKGRRPNQRKHSGYLILFTDNSGRHILLANCNRIYWIKNVCFETRYNSILHWWYGHLCRIIVGKLFNHKAMTDFEGHWDARLSTFGPILLIVIELLGNFAQIIGWRSSSLPIIWEILDPPLQTVVEAGSRFITVAGDPYERIFRDCPQTQAKNNVKRITHQPPSLLFSLYCSVSVSGLPTLIWNSLWCSCPVW